MKKSYLHARIYQERVHKAVPGSHKYNQNQENIVDAKYRFFFHHYGWWITKNRSEPPHKIIENIIRKGYYIKRNTNFPEGRSPMNDSKKIFYVGFRRKIGGNSAQFWIFWISFINYDSKQNIYSFVLYTLITFTFVSFEIQVITWKIF